MCREKRQLVENNSQIVHVHNQRGVVEMRHETDACTRKANQLNLCDDPVA